MMKKILYLLIVVVISLTSCIVVYANNEIQVKIDGKKIEFDVNPIIENGRTLVPMRYIFEELGATVEWNGKTQTITSQRDDKRIVMGVGSNKMSVNFNEVVLDVAPIIVSQRTMVPARAVSEAFNCEVDWDGKTNTVYIITKPELCKKGHQLTEATCTQPQKCINCGRDFGDKLEHILSNHFIINEPSCSQQGMESFTCELCGEVFEKDIPALEHIPGDWQNITTETAIGKKVKKCTVCDQICAQEEYQKNPTQIKEDYKWLCPTYSYLELSRMNNNDRGKKIHVKGRILQSIEEGNYFMFLVEITKLPYGWDDTIMVLYNRNNADLHRFVEDEIIEIYGEYGGLYQYETLLSVVKTVPRIDAKYVDKGYIILDE